MILPYEMVYKVVIPTIRSMISKRLYQSYNLTQEEVANKLDITQAAVSHYLKGKRANMLRLEDIKEIRDSIDELSNLLFVGNIPMREVRERITEVCDYVRESKLLCEIHKQLEPNIDFEGCYACNKSLLGRLKII